MSGRCLCGKVELSASEVETAHHTCHCGMCRRWSGGSGFFGAVAEKVTFTGDAHLARYKSSDWAERGFCTSCGTNLFYYLIPANRYVISVGVFDDPSPFRLVREIFIDHKPPGYAFAGEHPRWTEEETFARLTPPE
jgi:hypothetical protein